MLAVGATVLAHVNRRAQWRPIAATLAGADRYAYGKGGGLPLFITIRPGTRNLPRLGCGSGTTD
jgi:hypothetical protein